MAQRMLERTEALSKEGNADPLTFAQAKAMVLHCMNHINSIYLPEKVAETTLGLQVLKDQYPDDILLARLLVKSFLQLLHNEGSDATQMYA